MNGHFIISLDFELMWGVRENRTIESYGDAILDVHSAMPKTLDIFDKYAIGATVAAVGFLFLKNREEMLSHIPAFTPNYANQNISPYGCYIENINNFTDNRYHFAPEIINDIKQRDNHEIATHTLSHYNALAEGQTIESFRADLSEAIKIANEKHIEFRTIIFPRNQCNRDYLSVCKEFNIICYRGADRYKRSKTLRNIDRYIPLFNDRAYPISDLFDDLIINVWGSEHWRPNIKSQRAPIGVLARIERIKKHMLYAAKNGLIYHIWWHPHEFGRFTDEKLGALEKLCCYYRELNERYGFQSVTMGRLAAQATR
ncbi:MAG: polysaccharide deacetylase family protein [Helicobacteraceae bacterium]|jgi:peptidoglycan/xylan/chitin deacetylase (PgdA/CDA1 family)|nr:polysaccharide deacetylase family protein [Helicobacteraceae bacterium]